MAVVKMVPTSPSNEATTAPAGMAGRHAAALWIRDQHRRAVSTCYPQALAAGITHQAIGFRPGIVLGCRGRQHSTGRYGPV